MTPNLVILIDEEVNLYAALIVTNKSESLAEQIVDWINYHMRKEAYANAADCKARSGIQEDVWAYLPDDFCPATPLKWSSRAYLAIRTVIFHVRHDLGEHGLAQLLAVEIRLREKEQAHLTRPGTVRRNHDERPT